MALFIDPTAQKFEKGNPFFFVCWYLILKQLDLCLGFIPILCHIRCRTQFCLASCHFVPPDPNWPTRKPRIVQNLGKNTNLYISNCFHMRLSGMGHAPHQWQSNTGKHDSSPVDFGYNYYIYIYLYIYNQNLSDLIYWSHLIRWSAMFLYIHMYIIIWYNNIYNNCVHKNIFSFSEKPAVSVPINLKRPRKVLPHSTCLLLARTPAQRSGDGSPWYRWP